MNRFLLPSLLLLIGLTGQGCGGSSLETPRLNLVNLGQVDLKGLAGSGNLQVRIANPNPDPITVEGLSLDLLVNGSRLASGMAQIGQSVPAYGQIDVNVPTTMSNFALLRATVSTVQGKKVDHGLSGTITFRDMDGTRIRRRVRKSGSIDASSLGLE